MTTTVLETATVVMHSVNMTTTMTSEAAAAANAVKNEPNYDTVRQTLREAIR